MSIEQEIKSLEKEIKSFKDELLQIAGELKKNPESATRKKLIDERKEVEEDLAEAQAHYNILLANKETESEQENVTENEENPDGNVDQEKIDELH
jgi:hypothetical protein